MGNRMGCSTIRYIAVEAAGVPGSYSSSTVKAKMSVTTSIRLKGLLKRGNSRSRNFSSSARPNVALTSRSVKPHRTATALQRDPSPCSRRPALSQGPESNIPSFNPVAIHSAMTLIPSAPDASSAAQCQLAFSQYLSGGINEAACSTVCRPSADPSTSRSFNA